MLCWNIVIFLFSFTLRGYYASAQTPVQMSSSQPSSAIAFVDTDEKLSCVHEHFEP